MEQVSRLSQRFQLSTAVASQAAEFYRLAEVRGMLRVRGVSSTALAMVCLEIASGQHGETFDKEQSQKLSGLPSRTYASTVHSVGKMLNLSATVSLREMAVRFGCLEAEHLATETLHSYGKKVESEFSTEQRESMNLTKPIYSAAALYTACKMLKFRCDKAQFQSAASCASKAVFQAVLDQMSGCVPKKTADEKGGKARKRKGKTTQRLNEDGSTPSDTEHAVSSRDTDSSAKKQRQQDGTDNRAKSKRENLQSRIVSSPLSKDYLHWKETVLTEPGQKIAEHTLTTS